MKEKAILNNFKLFLKEKFQPGELIWNFDCFSEILKMESGIWVHPKINNLEKKFDYDSITLLREKELIIIAFFKSVSKKLNLNIIDFETFANSYLLELANKGYLTKDGEISLKLFLEENTEDNIFFIREFNNEESLKLFKKLKDEISKKLKIDTIMLETEFKSGNLNSRIYNEIRKARYVVADLTSKNDNYNNNVIYEIGLAHGFNKKVLMIIDENKWPFKQDSDEKNISNLPFDISTHTTIPYSTFLNEKMSKDVEEIVKTISSDIE